MNFYNYIPLLNVINSLFFNNELPFFIKKLMELTREFEKKELQILDSLSIQEYFYKVLFPWILDNLEDIVKYNEDYNKKDDIKLLIKRVKDENLKEILKDIIYLADEIFGIISKYNQEKLKDLPFLLSALYLASYFVFKGEIKKSEFVIDKAIARMITRELIEEIPKEYSLKK